MKSQVYKKNLLVSYSLDSTYLSYITLDLMLGWERIDQRFGYEPNQTGYESSELGMKRPLSVSIVKRMKGCWWFKCCRKHSTLSRTK